MTGFVVHFLICNLFISFIVIILLITKRIFKNSLSARIQYNLWFLFLGLLAVPFIPLRLISVSQIFSFLEILKNFSTSHTETVIETSSNGNLIEAANWMNDFTLSVSIKAPSRIGIILAGIWIIGIFIMLIVLIKKSLHLRILKNSALPLQNLEIRRLYNNCLDEMNIKNSISIYSTAFLKSPIIMGFFKPCIYLPIHLISDYNTTDLRYMLLHELQHYKHKDILAGYIMNLAGMFYWFNPFVWYALKEMSSDREIACDTAVLNMLEETSYEDYGNTLINFAEKLSLFPFISKISGNMKQINRRIINIASYEKPSFEKKLKSIFLFGIITIVFLSLTPILSSYATDRNHYQWTFESKNISIMDFSRFFHGYEGSFVLYNLENNTWNIYNMEYATLRTSPNSTYKIYNALFGLEEGVITPENSIIAWDKTNYPIEAWNTDQNLDSAMQSSVNWYFQSIDKQLGKSVVKHYIQKIGYGNENMHADSSYWMQSSLKISPIEQVELLKKLFTNGLDFTPHNIDTVKNSIHILSTEHGDFYGKTGTGQVNEKNVNGWFVGCIKNNDNTYFFSTNIQSSDNATGSKASEISLSILSDMNIWK
ncbi:MAG: BlaR1 family beta-lactam sensor/signal transducer [Lachnospiraceae bacterium]|nr:BlaR1 family beta-lactam sensor/signal transducer [Lachnospiraceae bacterium]